MATSKPKPAAKKPAAKKPTDPEELDYEPAHLHDFVDVVSGPHQGRYGVLVIEVDEANFIMRTRDAESTMLNVMLKDVRTSEAGRR